eukprot:maker-scaffold1086_size63525-snap-gene-0.14 protein:Tk01503 transcript:maker-scaffold1086_size63525-snap-gene-0.14-mRNA-1 annotation:"microtubule associated protein"
MAEEDTEYLKLPVEERCVHKLWKARMSGYEECVKTFQQWDNDDPNWKKFAPIIKKFVIDSNVIAQEKGLQATLVFVQNSDLAPRQADSIVDGLVTKCIGAPKAKTKEIAKQIALMLCEIEVHERVIEELIKGLAQKNPKVVSGCLNTMTDCLRCFGAKVVKVSPLLKATMPLLDHRDKTVRDEGKQLIIESYRWVGGIMKQQLTGLKPVQLTELDGEFEKVAEAGKAKPERHLRSQMPTPGGNAGGEAGDEIDGEGGQADEEEEEDEDPYNLMDPVDILSQLPKNFYELVEEKKWQLRKEALDALLPLTKNPKIAPGDYNDLVRVLKKFISKDSNVMLVALAAQCFSGLAKGLRSHFKNHANSSLSILLEKFKEKKTNVLTALIEAVDSVYIVLDIEAVQEDCLAALKHKTPSVNTETAKFLARCFSKCPPQLVSNKKVLKGYVSALMDRLTHPDVAVRDGASEALGVLIKFLGEPQIMRLMPDLDNIKLTKIKEFSEKAELSGKPAAAMAAAAPKPATKSGANVTKPKAKVVKPTGDPAPKAPASAPAGAPRAKSGSAPPEKKTSTKAASRPATAKPAPAASARKKGEEIDLSAPYIATNLKSVRFKEESKLKVLKWNFATPRQEFVDQLKDQMTTASFNQTLFTQMYHNDFKQHLKAIETLTKALDQDVEALKSNLDLILKWMTLRFFETNPSVLLKGLEYLNKVFALLSETSYNIHDIEAMSFIPYLINKVGDPKDQVRASIKNILKVLCQVYPASKMSPYLMDGLKSKNAKQRGECLDELGILIQSYGTTILHPTPGACVKEIAKQIAERDNSVRSAALNCITEVYFQDGEKMYKALGNLPEKDMAMLEERIKRTGKSRPPPKSAQPPPPPVKSDPPSRAGSANPPASRDLPRIDKPGGASSGLVSRLTRPQTGGAAITNGSATFTRQQARGGESIPPSVRSNGSPLKSRPISGAFTLDLDKIESVVNNMDDDSVKGLVEHNLDDIFNHEPVALPTRRQFPSPPSNSMPLSYLSGARSIPVNKSQPQYPLADMPEAYEMLDVVLAQIFNQDTEVCIGALVQLDELIKDAEKVELLGKRMDQLLVSCYMQYRYVLHTKMKTDNFDPKDVMRIFQYLTMVLMSLYHHQHLTKTASTGALHDLLHIIICLLLETQVQELPQGAQLIRALNVLTVKIIDRSDHTNVMLAFCKLLKDSIGNSSFSSKYIDLVMKCLWKAIRAMTGWIDDMNLDLIMAELHDFLKVYPSSYWKQQSSDTPMRTVKTIIHSMVKLRGDEILDHLSRVPDPDNSELVPYLKKLLSNGVGKENAATGDGGTLTDANAQKKRAQRFSRSDHETLAEIFKKIGHKEHTKLGLQELYNFKQQNPQADLEPFLAKSSQYFRDYIERGLKNIEVEISQNGGSRSASSTGSSGLPGSSSNRFGSVLSDASKENTQPTPAHSQYLERLRKLREQGGLEGKGSASYTSSAYRIASSSSVVSSSSTTSVTSERHPSGDIMSDQQENNRVQPPPNVEDIRKRLERIKQSAF